VKTQNGSIHIVVFGLNHTTAPVEVREKVFVDQTHIPVLLDTMKSSGIKETVILSTCNRTEFYFSSHDVQSVAQNVKMVLARYFDLEPPWLEGYTYLFTGPEAYRHLFLVASGLDSMVVGEPQILGQVKEAYRIAASSNATDFYLNKAFHRAFHVAKRIRTETKIGYNPVSISSMAVELGKRIFGGFDNKKILVVGAGEMCEIALKQFRKEGLEDILITNRTSAAAQKLAQETMGVAHHFEDIPELLTQVDMVLTSTGSEEPIISLETATAAMKKRKSRPLFLIDIAVPRDVDHRVNNLENAYLYDIDDLKDLAQRHLADRVKESERALAIVEEEIGKFSHWFDRLDGAPIIADIVGIVEEIRQRELKKSLQRMKVDDVEVVRQLDILTKSITSKLIHPHIALIRENGSPAVLDMMKRIFRLDKDEDIEKDLDSGNEG
jgi:glutamyl-tRNA reductase